MFVCKYLLFTFYPIVSEIVYMRNYFIHELELENDRGAVETSFLFFIACFYNKIKLQFEKERNTLLCILKLFTNIIDELSLKNAWLPPIIFFLDT